VVILNSVQRMASGARQDGAANKTSVLALPAELLELTCSFLEDPDDLASCHMVHTRCAGVDVHLTEQSAPQMPAPLMQQAVAYLKQRLSLAREVSMVQVLRSSKGYNEDSRATAPRVP
jgi:hypothetical protein